MVDMISTAAKYWLFRLFGFPSSTPLSLAVSVTHRCNFRCKICNVYTKKHDELTLDEYSKIFKSIGNGPRWITITGGEPFLRNDLGGIIDLIAEHVNPDAITIASNGFFMEHINRFVVETVKKNKDIKFIINLSLDAIGPTHDEIRGMKSSFERVMETFNSLKTMEDIPNLHIGFNTVVSKFNISHVPSLIKYVDNFEPDSHVFEIAQPREELHVANKSLQPKLEEFLAVNELIINNLKVRKVDMHGELIYYFRSEYYRLTAEILKRKEQVIPCFAGTASAHISPSGIVYPCCTLARPMGNLRDFDYNFHRVWQTPAAGKLRRSIAKGECYCCMANAAYTNILLNIPSVMRIMAKYAVKQG